MKVSDLIERLAALPQDFEVRLYTMIGESPGHADLFKAGIGLSVLDELNHVALTDERMSPHAQD